MGLEWENSFQWKKKLLSTFNGKITPLHVLRLQITFYLMSHCIRLTKYLENVTWGYFKGRKQRLRQSFLQKLICRQRFQPKRHRYFFSYFGGGVFCHLLVFNWYRMILSRPYKFILFFFMFSSWLSCKTTWMLLFISSVTGHYSWQYVWWKHGLKNKHTVANLGTVFLLAIRVILRKIRISYFSKSALFFYGVAPWRMSTFKQFSSQ